MTHSPCRLPAEWEPHAATWLAWPRNRLDWPGKFAPHRLGLRRDRAQALTVGEKVRILVDDADWRGPGPARAGQGGRGGAPSALLPHPHGQGLDPGHAAGLRAARPESPTVAAVSFGFNGWAKYPDHVKDALVAEQAWP